MTINASPLVDPVVTLHRYFIWANLMRTHFDQLAPSAQFSKAPIEAFLYMSYWYGGLYVVIEGWQELKLSDQSIETLLSSPNVDLLRRYRHGCFHFQKNYSDDRFMKFFDEGTNVVSWVRELNKQFGRFFLERSQAVLTPGTSA